MNFKLSSLVLILGLNTISCYVKNDNSSEVTTKLSLESSKSMVTKGVNNEKENHTEVVNQESRVYLEDVLFMLRNHEWGAEEQPCLLHIQRLLYNLQNFTLWAVWDWDSQASEPQGILSGNQYQLGNFDQCMKPPWSKTYPEFRTKYCLAQIKLDRTDMAPRRRVIKPHNPYQSALDFIEYRPPHSRPLNELTWGACVPAVCGRRTVERLFGVMLAHSHLGTAGMRANISIMEPCQTTGEQQEFDGLFYAFVGVAAFLILISVVCTCLNSQDKELTPNTTRTELIQAFCIKRNASDLLKMRKDGVEVLYGIRILTMCLIVLDHQIGISNAGPISDGVRFDEEVVSPLGHFIVHDDLFVDTFFFLSGFLTMTTLLRFKKLPNPIILILRRYVRMVVAFALTVFYLAAVFPYTGSGPLWRRVTEYEAGSCRDNWWLNILMLSNYVHTDNMCFVVSWYTPCDFHFFVVTIFAYCLYKKFPRLGAVVAVLLATGSIIIPAIIHYAYQLPAVQLFTFDFVSNPRASEQFKLSYITSHTRYAAYLVGFYSGYLFVKHGNNGNLSMIKQKWSVLGTCSALVVMLGVMVLGSTFLWRSYHPLEGAVYAALNRPVWATGIAALVLCCSLGHVPLVKSFLSWYPWVPLSRLAYGLYLTHSIIITRNVFVTRNPQHNDYFDILNAAVGVIFWGCVASLLLWLFAEAPANKLLSICLKFNVQANVDKEPDKRASESNPTSTSASMSSDPTGNNGHLHDNLPAHITYYSSKV